MVISHSTVKANESSTGGCFDACIARRIDVKFAQNRKKWAIAAGPEFAGRPWRSSSQKDLHSPVASDPVVYEVTDLRISTKRQSYRPSLAVMNQLSSFKMTSNVVPSTRSMMLIAFSWYVIILRMEGPRLR